MMEVTKRDGTSEPVSFDKVLRRIQSLTSDLKGVDAGALAKEVISKLSSGVHTNELDEYAAWLCSTMVQQHLDYSVLAARLAVSNRHKGTPHSFSEGTRALLENRDALGRAWPVVDAEYAACVARNAAALDAMMVPQRDYDLDYFALKTMDKSYLLHTTAAGSPGERKLGSFRETPQHMWLRVAVWLHGDDMAKVSETYDLMSTRQFTHATPTLFNAGTTNPQGSSCFVLDMDDSMEGITDCFSKVSSISKSSGGLGINISKVRAKGSVIRSSNGKSNGVVPMLRCLNAIARYVDQGGGKRKGGFAVYLETWHADIKDFLPLRRNFGVEEERCRDLFTAVVVSDLFMRRVTADEKWNLFCPDECPGLVDAYGDEFEDLYMRYSQDPLRVRESVPARDIWNAILESQCETGTPFVVSKDAMNHKSNQKHSGVVRTSNLCTEITLVTDVPKAGAADPRAEELAVCNLGSVRVAAFVKDGSFDFDGLRRATAALVRNLNNVIDNNAYPLGAARESNLRHRPIGVGVQGLADAFIMLRMPYESDEASALNHAIFENMYFAAVSESCRIARERKESSAPQTPEEAALPAEYYGAYASFVGSPLHQGLFQFDLWDRFPPKTLRPAPLRRSRVGAPDPKATCDWESLRVEVAKHGVRNSTLMAPMPTASTAQILGSTESFAPITSTYFKRTTLAGEFVVFNTHLAKRLEELGIWTPEVRRNIQVNEGSVQNIEGLPEADKQIFKTAWEMRQRNMIDMAADRGRYICQSQSSNLFFADIDYQRLSMSLLHAWQRGLKTLVYYVRSKPVASVQKFTAAPPPAQEAAGTYCRRGGPDCEACSG